MKEAACFIARREKLGAQLEDAVLILPAARQVRRNGDVSWPYRFDSDLYYLTGYQEPDAWFVLNGGNTPKSLLFCRPKDRDKEMWEGTRLGPEAAQATLGFDQAFSSEHFMRELPALLVGKRRILFPFGRCPHLDGVIHGALKTARELAKKGQCVPSILEDPRPLLGEMRLYKDETEFALLQKAAQLNVRAHRRAMLAAHTTQWEYQLEAEILHEYGMNGCRQPAYPTIVASGNKACILHYTQNNQPLRKGELVLVDAGCEIEGYASDITRTFPINGRFSGAQKAVYEIVLAAQEAAIAQMKLGNLVSSVGEAALAVLVQGMVDLKLLEGSVSGLIESGAYKAFYMHGIGHWMGLDVHDTGGQFDRHGQARTFQAGMVMTVEPGLYIATDAKVPEAFAGIGVRIEDNVLMTASGASVLTDRAPKKIQDIEALMNHESFTASR